MLGTIKWEKLFGAALRRLGGPGFWRGMRLAAQGPTLTLLSRLQRYASDRRAFCWEGRWATGHRRGGNLCFTAGAGPKTKPELFTSSWASTEQAWDTDAKTDGLPPLGRSTLCLVELDAQAQATAAAVDGRILQRCGVEVGCECGLDATSRRHLVFECEAALTRPENIGS